jgi:8-amino-7-oxononanoate synthase
VRGIRPPTVPAGTARLRLSLTLNVTEVDVDALAGALQEALA